MNIKAQIYYKDKDNKIQLAEFIIDTNRLSEGETFILQSWEINKEQKSIIISFSNMEYS